MWESRDGTTDLVRTIWRATVEEPDVYLVDGSEFWGISFARATDGVVTAVLNGPNLRAEHTDSILGETYWGVELAAYVAVAGMSKQPVLGLTVPLEVRDDRVRIGDLETPVPAFDDLDAWIDVLIRDGALVVDDDVRAALAGDRVGATPRTWQRRYRRTVGLTAAQVEQIRRAERAFSLLQQGHRPAEAAALAGFADQAHLTRSLRLIRGRTPASILSAAAARPD